MPKRHRSNSSHGGNPNKKRKFFKKAGGKKSLQNFTNIRGILFTCDVKKQNEAKREALTLVEKCLEDFTDEERVLARLPEELLKARGAQTANEESAEEKTSAPLEEGFTISTADVPQDSEPLKVAESDTTTQDVPAVTSDTPTPTANTTPVDISRQLKDELDEQSPCVALESGVGGNFFIRLRDNIDPAVVISKIMQNFEESGVQSRFISKMVPVTRVCHVKENLIRDNLKMVCERAFSGLTSFQFKHWKLDFQKKNNSSFNKQELHEWVQDYVKRWHIVDRKNPEIVIFVWVVQRVCVLGAITDYDKLHQLNLNIAKKDLEDVEQKADEHMAVSVFASAPAKEEKPTQESTQAEQTQKEDSTTEQPRRKKKKKNVGGIRLL